MLLSLALISLLFGTLATLFVQCGGSAKNDGPPNRTTTKSATMTAEPPKRQADIAPKKMELNDKENLIKQGLQTGKHAYPTLEDIPSDWSDKDGKDKKEGKEKGEGKKKKKKAEKSEVKDVKEEKKDEEKKEEEKKDDDKKSQITSKENPEKKEGDEDKK